ncbi:glycosyltransferase family 2 protein [Robiginitalea sp. M366]|uniref:glycosyltransferase family 2 protein n=1 Tax=Robiginitalea aestuariiviva TaxID=3036903 RepID=UPI00240E167B|nr:glycosyltransferase family 2 protein [Robiginitalea aestuariiviva]MDG1573017.1 glycosyltransferase family 2 protein [Robiginitalea aestuariiviva]
MEKPLVSLLMPFRNTAAYLPECLDSIRVQSYLHWELLAVDDHSTDASRSLLEQAAREDERIRVLEPQGRGIIPALRQAYRHSRGSLISRMDSDDRMDPQRMETMSRQLVENGEGHLALGLVRYFSDRGISNGYARYESWLNALTASGANFSEIYKECVIPSPCWMAWRTDLERCGAFKPDRYPEDYDLCFRFYADGLTCLPSSELLHYWRDYEARTSRNSEHYAQNYFLEIKTHYFLHLDHDPTRPLVIWGAGFKGKKVARLLDQAGVPFRWVCDNPNKIGKRIYGHLMEPYRVLQKEDRPQSIVTVANASAQKDIRVFLEGHCGQQAMEDFFFFC